ncbi:MAG TPA: 4'-phosphopantetheinyl transferase superfamily protein [Solirubrobacteraceae bacterium]
MSGVRVGACAGGATVKPLAPNAEYPWDMQGVGMDLVEIGEVSDSIETFGEKYLGRVFTSAERNECGTSPARLAERFAAKEAILKALHADGPVPLAAIDTRAAGRGQLTVHLTAEAATLAGRRGVVSIGVSVSRAHGQAAAVAATRAT